MKGCISYVTALCLIMSLFMLSPEISFAQSEDPGLAESSSGRDGAYVEGITPARARALVGGVFGLVSIIVGWRARAKSAAGKTNARAWSISALVLGLGAVILSIVHLLGNTGGFGTGGGKAGAIVALVLGIVGAVLGGLAMRNGVRKT